MTLVKMWIFGKALEHVLCFKLIQVDDIYVHSQARQNPYFQTHLNMTFRWPCTLFVVIGTKIDYFNRKCIDTLVYFQTNWHNRWVQVWRCMILMINLSV